MPITTEEAIARTRQAQTDAQIAAEKARLDAAAAVVNAQTTAAETQGQLRQQAQEQAEEGLGPIGPQPVQVNAAAPGGAVSPANIMLAGPGGARGGAAAQRILKGATGGGVPPVIQRQRFTEEVAPFTPPAFPGITLAARTRRRTTDVQPNVLTPGDVLRARVAMRGQDLAFQEGTARIASRQSGRLVRDEGEALGMLAFQAEQDPTLADSFQQNLLRLRGQFGGDDLLRITAIADTERRKLQLRRDLEDFQSRLIERRAMTREERAASLREEREAEDPRVQERRRASEIRLRVLGGETPTPEERRFLDEVTRADPIRSMIRDAVDAAGQRPTAGQPVTQEQIDMAQNALAAAGEDVNAVSIRNWIEKQFPGTIF